MYTLVTYSDYINKRYPLSLNAFELSVPFFLPIVTEVISRSTSGWMYTILVEEELFSVDDQVLFYSESGGMYWILSNTSSASDTIK